MDKVVVDAEVRAKLNGLDRELGLVDPAGKTLGVFVPREQYQAMMLAWLSREPTQQELDAALDDYNRNGGYSTTEVMAHLAEVERQWRRDRG